MPLTYRDRGTSGTQTRCFDWKNVLSVMVKRRGGLVLDVSFWADERAARAHGRADRCEEAKAGIERDWQAPRSELAASSLEYPLGPLAFGPKLWTRRLHPYLTPLSALAFQVS